MTEETNAYTRAVSLWINATYEAMHDRIVEEARQSAEIYADNEDLSRHMADYIRQQVEESTPDLSGMWADLMGLALDEVDYSELAETFLEEVEE